MPWSLRNPHPLPPRLFSAGSWACKKRFLDGGEKMHNRSSSWKIPLFSMLDHPPALNSHFSWACEKKQPQVPSLLYAYIHIIYIYMVNLCIYICVCVYVCTSKQFTVSIYIFNKTPIPLVHSNHLLNIYILYNVPSYNGYVTIYGLYIQITILSKDVILYIANRYPDIRITIIHYLVGGIPTLPLWKMMASVSWDDIPKWMESHKIPWFQTTNQRLLVYKPLWSPLTIVISTINHS